MNPYLLVALTAIITALALLALGKLFRRETPKAEAAAFTALSDGAHLLADITGDLKARAQAEHNIRAKVQGLQALAAFASHQAEIASAALPPVS